MSERVRIHHFEAEEVRRIIGEYASQRNYTSSCTRGDFQAEDLVNAIGEIYERARAREEANLRDDGEIRVNDLASSIEGSIRAAIRERIEEAKEEIIERAVCEFDKEVRKLVGAVAVNIANMYSIQSLANELVIRVRIEEPKS